MKSYREIDVVKRYTALSQKRAESSASVRAWHSNCDTQTETPTESAYSLRQVESFRQLKVASLLDLLPKQQTKAESNHNSKLQDTEEYLQQNDKLTDRVKQLIRKAEIQATRRGPKAAKQAKDSPVTFSRRISTNEVKESPIPLAALYNPTLNLVKGNYRLTSDLESPIAIKLDSKHEYQYSTSQGQYSHKLLKSTAKKHVYAGDTLSGYHET
jgi:septal ring factor EnvC (AmiA/AmiB activator)